MIFKFVATVALHVCAKHGFIRGHAGAGSSAVRYMMNMDMLGRIYYLHTSFCS